MKTNNELMGKGMRRVMLAAAVLNTLGALTFIPSFTGLRAQGHLPNDAHPVYLWMIALWIFFFGVAYLYLGLTGKVEKVFVAVGAAGKLSFFGLLLGFALAGGLPIQAALSGIGDLIFGTIFTVWLWRTRT
jgi:hypothetical protein